MTGKRKRKNSQGPNKVCSKKGNHLPEKLHSKCTGDEKSIKHFKTELQASSVQHSQEDLNIALIDAVKNRHEECVKLLLDAGASVTIQDEFSRSLLCLAAYDHRPGGQGAFLVDRKIVGHLTNAGIDVNELFWEPYGQFPLFVILPLKGLQYYDLVKFMLTHGANINGVGTAPNPFGEKSIRHLSLVALRAEPMYVKLFLNNGANPNGLSFAPGSDAIRPIFPPICGIILLGRLKVLKCLLMHNASTNIENLSTHFHGISLISMVFLASYPTLKTKVSILEMLRKFGCKMWDLKHITECDEFPYPNVQLSILFSKPLSLLEQSRIAVLHAMGGKYLSNIHSLQIPASLHSYLEFNDVSTEEEERRYIPSP